MTNFPTTQLNGTSSMTRPDGANQNFASTLQTARSSTPVQATPTQVARVVATPGGLAQGINQTFAGANEAVANGTRSGVVDVNLNGRRDPADFPFRAGSEGRAEIDVPGVGAVSQRPGANNTTETLVRASDGTTRTATQDDRMAITSAFRLDTTQLLENGQRVFAGGLNNPRPVLPDQP